MAHIASTCPVELVVKNALKNVGDDEWAYTN